MGGYRVLMRDGSELDFLLVATDGTITGKSVDGFAEFENFSGDATQIVAIAVGNEPGFLNTILQRDVPPTWFRRKQ